MNGLFDSEKSREITTRLKNLNDSSKAIWGTMTVSQMLCHQIDALEVVLKLKPSAYPEGFNAKLLANPLGRWMVIYSPLPWPKGKIKGPNSFFVSKPDSFHKELSRVLELIDQFLNKSATDDFGKSPFLGKLTGQQWADLLYRHFDHHLQQFEV